jgi:hypothetical protein
MIAFARLPPPEAARLPMFWLRKILQSHRRLADAVPRFQLGDAAQPGEVVKVVGTVRADGPLLRAPISDEPGCVCWVAKVRESGFAAQLLIDEGAATPFSVIDGGVRASVQHAPRLGKARELSDTSGPFDAAPHWVEMFLWRYGESSKRSGILAVNRALEYSEWRIDKDDRVAIVGRVRRAIVHEAHGDQDEHGYRDAPTTAVQSVELVLEGTPEEPVLLELER